MRKSAMKGVTNGVITAIIGIILIAVVEMYLGGVIISASFQVLSTVMTIVGIVLLVAGTVTVLTHIGAFGNIGLNGR